MFYHSLCANFTDSDSPHSNPRKINTKTKECIAETQKAISVYEKLYINSGVSADIFLYNIYFGGGVEHMVLAHRSYTTLKTNSFVLAAVKPSLVGSQKHHSARKT